MPAAGKSANPTRFGINANGNAGLTVSLYLRTSREAYITLEQREHHFNDRRVVDRSKTATELRSGYSDPKDS